MEPLTGFEGNGFAEYACTIENKWGLKPANLSSEEAPAPPIAATTAMQGLRDKGRIQPGREVLIEGASGGVGTLAVQIAKALGAEVTAVCSTRNAVKPPPRLPSNLPRAVRLVHRLRLI